MMTGASPASLDTAMMIPPTHMMGAMIIMRSMMRTVIWTWVTSLVLRVTRDGVPSLSNSCSENRETWVKMRRRRISPRPMEAWEERYPARMAQTEPPRATRSMSTPLLMM